MSKSSLGCKCLIAAVSAGMGFFFLIGLVFWMLPASIQSPIASAPDVAGPAASNGGETPAAKIAEDQTNESEPTIPGLMPVDVHGNLTTKGFTLEKNLGSIQCSWMCKKDLPFGVLMADVYGSDVDAVTSVQAIASAPDIHAESIKAQATEFLPYIASIPYVGADREAAQSWVRENIGQNTTKIIGGMKFELISTSPASFMLVISPPKSVRE